MGHANRLKIVFRRGRQHKTRSLSMRYSFESSSKPDINKNNETLFSHIFYYSLKLMTISNNLDSNVALVKIQVEI